MLTKRVYMAAEDSGGKSIVPPATSTPPAPPAQGAPDPKPAPATIDVATLVKEIRDGVFADLRRTGLLKKSAIRELEGGTAKPGDPATPAPALDLSAARAFDRTIGRLGYANNLSERQYARAE